MCNRNYLFKKVLHLQHHQDPLRVEPTEPKGRGGKTMRAGRQNKLKPPFSAVSLDVHRMIDDFSFGIVRVFNSKHLKPNTMNTTNNPNDVQNEQSETNNDTTNKPVVPEGENNLVAKTDLKSFLDSAKNRGETTVEVTFIKRRRE
jgi:hypothetical protein